ncbi:hypothetical protein B9G53_24045 [Pseudanabaena sp. SR411]|nr:hypothetical protein B9G53_24045 [Pseudanabaena sp. SR411]
MLKAIARFDIYRFALKSKSRDFLMAAFYNELQKGDVTVIEALRRAQVSLIKSPNFNHPNYWSAFLAIGNGL